MKLLLTATLSIDPAGNNFPENITKQKVEGTEHTFL